jgi:omega-amidase
MTCILGCAQFAGIWEEPEDSLQKAAICVERAAGEGLSIVCFPEQFATGWNPAAAQHIESIDGYIVSELRRLARTNGLAIVGSFRERTTDKPKNTCIAIGSSGDILARYAKIHLFSSGGEDAAFSPGDRIGIFAVDGMTFGLAVCYDLRFPEIFSAYARAGTQCVVVPSAWPCRRVHHFQLFVRARSLENQFYVAGVNTVGMTPVDVYCGGTCVANPSGDIIAAGSADEDLIVAQLDRDAITRARSRLSTVSDRREDLYQRLDTTLS